MKTEDFLNLDAQQVMEWVSSDDVTVNAEEEVFKGIVMWVSHNKSEREGDFPELLHQVRLTSVSHDFLLNELVKEELITKNADFFPNFVVDAMKLIVSATDGQVTQQPRKCLETCTDVIFVCGGRKALCYIPQENVWYRLRDSFFEHQNHTLGQYKSKICIFDSGDHKVGESQVMEYYEPNNTWGVVQIPKIMTNFPGYIVLKGELYVTCFSYRKGRIYRYDAEMNNWDEMKDAPTPLEYPSVVADDNYLYIIGGLDNGVALSTSTRFDPSSNKWEEVAALNEGRHRAFGAAMNGKVFIAGGQVSRGKVISSCEVYDPTTNEWQLMPSLKVPRYNASMVCFEGRLYVLGGSTPPIRALTVEVFDSERNEWTEISAVPVKSFETQQEEKKNYKFQACFARLYKGVIDKLEPLN